jgi:hypothetical protein
MAAARATLLTVEQGFGVESAAARMRSSVARSDSPSEKDFSASRRFSAAQLATLLKP